MCLALPGRVLQIDLSDTLPMAVADFGGVQKKVCISFTPEVKVGEYVIVHVGFAISILNEEKAQQTLDLLEAL